MPTPTTRRPDRATLDHALDGFDDRLAEVIENGVADYGSLAALARALGMDYWNLRYWRDQPVGRISIENLARLALIADVDLNWLVLGEKR